MLELPVSLGGIGSSVSKNKHLLYYLLIAGLGIYITIK